MVLTLKDASKLAASYSTDELIAINMKLDKDLSRNPSFKSMQKKYYWDALGWVKQYVDISLPEYSIKTLGMLSPTQNRIAEHGPHGIGKSVLASLIILWAGTVSTDCKIITTASVWAQLEQFLWPEVHKWFNKTAWYKLGIKPNLLTMQCTFTDQSKAFAVAPGKPENMEGGHAQRIVYLFDEAKSIEAGFWEAAEGAFSTPGDHIQIALSTPGDTSGVFYSICSRAHGYGNWIVRSVSLREAIRAKRVSMEWAREKREQWGVSNPVYLNRVWGIFAKDSVDSVIPLSWIMAAVNRWHAWRELGRHTTGNLVIGADTAGQGIDKTCFYYRYGNVITKVERFGKSRPMELAGKLKVALGKEGILNIDTSYGEGAGTADRLKEQENLKFQVNCINFGAKAERKDKSGMLTFANVRAEMW